MLHLNSCGVILIENVYEKVVNVRRRSYLNIVIRVFAAFDTYSNYQRHNTTSKGGFLCHVALLVEDLNTIVSKVADIQCSFLVYC